METASSPADLRLRRIQSAELSRGISNDAIYSAIEQIIEKKDLRGSLLDYGAGAGHLSRRLLAQNRFESVTGADLMSCTDDLVGQIAWVQQDLSERLNISDGMYDVVVAAEIIEHLENPRFTIREIFRLLKNGGWVIVTTPNNESLRSLLALILRGHYAAFTDSSYPAHITPLLRQDLRRIFRESAFAEPEFYFTREGSIPGAPAFKWQTLTLGLLQGLRFSDNVLAVARKPL